MIEVLFENSFKKIFKKKIKKNPDTVISFLNSFQKFLKDPFDKSLKTHKLSGRLNQLWAFSLEEDLRVIFFFVENHNKAVFIDIGSHDEVY